MNKKRNTITFLIFFLLVCLAILIASWRFFAPKFSFAAPQTSIASAFKPNKPLTAFNLQDTNGQVFNEKSLRGHWTLLFFGYTMCPDICPQMLGIVRDTWNLFSTKQQDIPVRFVFADISSKPVSTAELKQFLENYRHEFIGLSGTAEQMHALSDQLGIYSVQQERKLDHTSALLLIDTQGRLGAVFTPPFSADELAQDLRALIGQT